MKRTIICLFLIQAWFAANVHAAPQASDDAASEETSSNNSRKEKEGSSRSITETVLSGMRSPIGFSMGVFELYTPNLSGSTLKDKSAVFTMMRPRLFANANTRNTEFRFDYTFGYRTYNRRREIYSSDHSARLDVSHRLSRNASLQISDTFRSAFNDYGALPTSPSPTMYQPGFAQEFYAPNERATTNSLVTGVSYRAGKRTNVNVFGSYDIWRYAASSFADAQGIQVGIRGDHQINKWLFLNSSYSHYLNAVNARFDAASIHRLQVGGLKFKLGRSMEIYFSGGADYTRFQRTNRPAASYQAGLAKTSGSTLVSAVYHRGLSTVVGPQETLNGHVVSASLTQWLSRRVSVQLDSGYTRGASLGKKSKLEYVSGNAEVQIALQRHITFSMQGTYISQRGMNLSPDTPILNRYSISTGFQFFFASLNGPRMRKR
jgi:hypothetical protein